MDLSNLRSLGDMTKFFKEIDKLSKEIEKSWGKVEKSLGGSASSSKKLDSSLGGQATSSGGNGNAGGGTSVMSQPPMPGGKGEVKSSAGFQSANQNSNEIFGPPLVYQGTPPGKIRGQFIDDVLNGPVGKILKPAFVAGMNALPSVEEAFQMNTLKSRLRFQGFGSDAQIAAMLAAQSGQGTPNSLMDYMQGFGDVRQLGNNYSSIGRNLSIASNLTPGVGYAGAANALSSLNAPRNVNFLRMIGIQVRDQVSGNMRDLDKIIDDLWNVISRQVRGRSVPISVNDLRLSLQPGNALASLLDQYFGNDPYLRTIIEDGLYAKAQGAGAGDQVKLQEIGARSQAIGSQAARIGASARLLESVSGPMMFGFYGANKVSQGLSNLFNMPGLLQISRLMAGGKGFLDTFAGMGNGSGGMLLGEVGKLLGNIPFLAEGGPAAARNAYVVGEKGPELFVPESDGYVVPHHELDLNNLQFRGGRHAGGFVTVQGPDGSHGHPNVSSGQWHKHRPKGEQLSTDKLREILFAAGFRNGFKTKGGITINQIDDALAIISAESGRHPDNANFTGPDMSYGLFQINMKNDGPYPNMGKERLKKFGLQYDWDLYDPLKNAQAAYAISSHGMKWHPAWSTAKGAGLAGPWGNPRGNQGGGILSTVEGFFNQGVANTGIVGDIVGGVGGAAGNLLGNIKDFLSNKFAAATQAKDFLTGLFNLFKDMPGLGGQAQDPSKSSYIPNPANYREYGGAVSAMGVNTGGRGSVVNYGGVTIKIEGKRNWDERRLAQEIRKTLEYDNLMRKAVTH